MGFSSAFMCKQGGLSQAKRSERSEDGVDGLPRMSFASPQNDNMGPLGLDSERQAIL